MCSLFVILKYTLFCGLNIICQAWMPIGLAYYTDPVVKCPDLLWNEFYDIAINASSAYNLILD